MEKGVKGHTLALKVSPEQCACIPWAPWPPWATYSRVKCCGFYTLGRPWADLGHPGHTYQVLHRATPQPWTPEALSTRPPVAKGPSGRVPWGRGAAGS